MLMSILSVVAGFVAMSVLVMAGTIALTAALVPGGVAAMRASAQPAAPTRPYLAANLALSLVAAVVGGWVTARLAPRAPGGHLIALGALLLVMGVVSARMPQAHLQPPWYRVTIPIVGIAGVGLSALLVAAR
jgi:hypothetical protein